MIRHMRHGSPPRLMALQSILSPNRRESLPTPSAGVRIKLLNLLRLRSRRCDPLGHGWPFHDPGAVIRAIGVEPHVIGEKARADRRVHLGFKWSSQHLERGGCDDCSEAAFGSVRARRLALAWSVLCCTA